MLQLVMAVKALSEVCVAYSELCVIGTRREVIIGEKVFVNSCTQLVRDEAEAGTGWCMNGTKRAGRCVRELTSPKIDLLKD